MKKKRCFKCEKTLPLSEFYTHWNMTDGRLGKCKECTKDDVRSRYIELGGRAEYEKARQRTPQRRTKKLEYQRRARARHPERNRARAKVGYAVRTGKIAKKPCEGCGSPVVQAHHEDYSKPLDVKWLCFKCHREGEHGQKTRG